MREKNLWSFSKELSSARLEILGSYMVLLAIALIISLLFLQTVLISQLSDEIDAQLRHEVAELRQLSTGTNPSTGESYGDDIPALFGTFLRRNVPQSGEAFYTLIDGQPYASSLAPAQLFSEPELVATWAAISEPTQAEVDTDGGRVRYLAVPVETENGAQGLFVVAQFLDETRTRLNRTIQTGGLVFGLVFVGVSVFAWFAAGRVLRPIRLLTEAARDIEDTNWSERIVVRGNDEIAQLARTFNAMLDRLEEAFVAQRRFIDDASHELRTPITVIRGHLEVMGDDAAEWPQVRSLVIDELGRMSRMVEDLLLLARAEQPELLEIHPLDVDEFTHQVADKIAALSSDHEWILAESALLVMAADSDRLTQALMNLARNAVEHSDAGTPITLGSQANGDKVRFWVQDRGPGIPFEDQERIFARFSRVRSGHRASGGAGLGLAIVTTIVEAHHGRVLVDSVPGEGATFSIVLPIGGPGENP